MDFGADVPASPSSAAPRRRRSPFLRLAGAVLAALGVVILLAVVYQLWWTNVQAQRNTEQQRQELTQTWEQQRQALPPPPEAQPAPSQPEAQPAAPAVVVPIPSKAFGLMYIPRLQDHVWALPLLEGVDASELAQGIGHYPTTAMPGAIGNTAFAGHRATHGEPLAYIDRLVAGDKVYIETGAGWYTYQLTHDEIVAPTDVWVIAPSPDDPSATVPTEKILSLVTCHPRWGSTERWVWWGTLVDQRTWDQGAPPELAAMI
jgi:sortase A